jgi:DtxR family Mn-dependent transcriptional regulator
MLRKLQKAGFLEYKPYYGASLTGEGRSLALRMMRRHRLIELFLHRFMGYGWEQVHEEAEKLEHVVSDLFVARVDVLLGYPEKDPHGEAIPDAQGCRCLEEDTSLLSVEPGEYTVRKVTNDRQDFLAYLEKESIIPGTRFTLLEKAPFDGPLKMRIQGKNEPQYIGVEAAKSIYVLPVPPVTAKHRRGKSPEGAVLSFTARRVENGTRGTRGAGKRGSRKRQQKDN